MGAQKVGVWPNLSKYKMSKVNIFLAKGMALARCPLPSCRLKSPVKIDKHCQRQVVGKYVAIRKSLSCIFAILFQINFKTFSVN